MEETKIDINNEMAINIVMDNIAKLTQEYSFEKDEQKSKELKEKINVLNKIKNEIYLGNKEIINRVLEKNEKGIL